MAAWRKGWEGSQGIHLRAALPGAHVFIYFEGRRPSGEKLIEITGAGDGDKDPHTSVEDLGVPRHPNPCEPGGVPLSAEGRGTHSVRRAGEQQQQQPQRPRLQAGAHGARRAPGGSPDGSPLVLTAGSGAQRPPQGPRCRPAAAPGGAIIGPGDPRLPLDCASSEKVAARYAARPIDKDAALPALLRPA